MQYLLLIAALFVTSLAEGAGFDCGKATSTVERLICADKDLSALDNVLSEIFSLEVEQAETVSGLRASQRLWLTARNSCADGGCVKLYYGRRIAELSCDPQSRMAGSAIGSIRCSYYSMRVLERELLSSEERYGQRIAQESNNPEHTTRTLIAEQKTWRDYRAAQCALYGATEGGSDGWKNAFASLCELDETKKRLARIRKELTAK